MLAQFKLISLIAALFINAVWGKTSERAEHQTSEDMCHMDDVSQLPFLTLEE